MPEGTLTMPRLLMITKGLFVRSLFSVSSIISVWGVVTVRENTNFWLLLNISGLLFVEAAFTFSRKRMGEWKWFCPSVFLYLLSSLPSIWLIELRLLEDRLDYSEHVLKGGCASSEEVHANVTSLHRIQANIEFPIRLTAHAWSVALQQLLIFVLILGRWMLPKGKLTRDQLSQLLLVYIGIAADILEFSTEGLKLEQVRCHRERTIYILAIWNWSLLQFAIGLTVTKARKPRVAGLGLSQETKHTLNPVAACCETEVWGIMATIIMQDGPFLAMRLYLLVEVRAINHMMIFFTCKNILIILLQLYRLAVIYLEQPNRAQYFMQQTYARYRGHTFRSSGGSHGEPEIRPPKKRPNNMNQSSSRKRLVTSQKDYSFTEQSEPLVKPKNERQERRPTRSMQKRPSMDTGSNKRVRNDFKPIGPKETKIPPAPAAEAKPKVVDTGNPRGRQSGRRGSNKPKNVDWKTKSNNDDLKQKNLNAPRPVGGATGQGLQPKRSPQSSPSVPRMDASSNKPIERVNFSPPEYSDIYKNKLSQRNPSSRSAKPPETLPLNFLDPSKQRKQTTGVTLASPDDW